MTEAEQTTDELIKQLENRIMLECADSGNLLTSVQAAEVIQSRCYQILCRIRAILDNPNMDDAACFQRIEEIVELFEQYGSDGGCRHDF